MEEPIIEIQLLGKFAITRGERRLGETHGRVNKVWVLIEYLLAQRGTTISQERMIEVLWGDEECGNPVSYTHLDVYKRQALIVVYKTCDNLDTIWSFVGRVMDILSPFVIGFVLALSLIHIL